MGLRIAAEATGLDREEHHGGFRYVKGVGNIKTSRNRKYSLHLRISIVEPRMMGEAALAAKLLGIHHQLRCLSITAIDYVECSASLWMCWVHCLLLRLEKSGMIDGGVDSRSRCHGNKKGAEWG